MQIAKAGHQKKKESMFCRIAILGFFTIVFLLALYEDKISLLENTAMYYTKSSKFVTNLEAKCKKLENDVFSNKC